MPKRTKALPPNGKAPSLKRPKKPKATAAETAIIEQRRTIVAANLLAGLTYRDIVAALEAMDATKGTAYACSIGTISNDVSVILSRWRQEQVYKIDQMRQVELRRLDVLLNAVYDRAKTGTDDKAMTMILQIMDRRAKLMGLDKPTELSLSWKDEAGSKGLSEDDMTAIFEGAVQGVMAKIKSGRKQGKNPE